MGIRGALELKGLLVTVAVGNYRSRAKGGRRGKERRLEVGRGENMYADAVASARRCAFVSTSGAGGGGVLGSSMEEA